MENLPNSPEYSLKKKNFDGEGIGKTNNIKKTLFAATPVIMKKENAQIKCFDSAGPGLT